MFVNTHFAYLECAYFKKERCYGAKSAVYFYVKNDKIADFGICISVPLTFPKYDLKGNRNYKFHISF